MKLYYHPLSTYSQKVLVACNELGIRFDGHLVNLFDAEERAEYRKTYPLCKVPLLILDDGHPIRESTIITKPNHPVVGSL